MLRNTKPGFNIFNFNHLNVIRNVCKKSGFSQKITIKSLDRV